MIESMRAAAARFRKAVEPRANGLPNRRVLLYPLILLAIIFAGFVATGVNGTSSGYLHESVSSSADPNLLLGTPQAIRSDEWYVQDSWMISQVEQGVPVENHTFPGGMNTTVQQDLPSKDWSVAFRPEVTGFFFLPFDQASAFRWWLPVFAMIAACYFFVVTVLPRRPVTAALLTVGFFFSPFLQWWFLSITFWPPAWALLVMGGVVWAIKSRGLISRIAIPVLIGYGTAVMALAIYVPFIIAAFLAAFAFTAGVVLSKRTDPSVGIWARLWRLKWIVVGGFGGALVAIAWMLTRWSTIEKFLGTVYPGQRLQVVGTARLHDFFAIFSGPLSSQLGAAWGVPGGANASESSTFLLVGVFLAVPLLWYAISRWRSADGVDWMTIALVAMGMILAAFMFIPGWGAIAHLLLLDRMTIGRARLALGILSLALTVVFIDRYCPPDRSLRAKLPAWVGVIAVGVSVVITGAVAVWLHLQHSLLVQHWWFWAPQVALFLAAIVLYCAKRPAIASAALALVAVLCAGFVNPLYVGTFNMNDTALVKAMKARSNGGAWVGVGAGDRTINAALVESGLTAYNGFQSGPPELMWKQIDPKDKFKNVWNRLADVEWTPGTGAPVGTNPFPDTIVLTFSACASFAQQHVSHVLSNQPLTGCLANGERIKTGPTTFWIYDVAKR